MHELRTRAAPVDGVDTVTVISRTECTARKLIREDDPYIEGHYPQFKVYPGVFIIESVQQAVHYFIKETRGKSVNPELTTIPSVRFTAPLVPSDTLDIHCACLTDDDGALVVKARCTNGRVKVARMTLGFRLVEATAEGSDA